MLNRPTDNATQGERSFFARTETFISQYNGEIIGYIEPEIGGMRPDFLLLSPSFGVMVVEIKDYLGDNIEIVTKSGDWSYTKNGEVIMVSNPFDQVYQYWRAIQDKINFSRFPERVTVPVTQVVCFAQISEKDRVAQQINRITPRRIEVCFKEAVVRNKKFIKFTKRILPTDLILSEHQFDVLRGNIVPFCRLPTLEQADIREPLTVNDTPRLLDRVQEETSLKLGSGHRLIFGVAGSGKTVILVARLKYLAERHPDWKILVLCYNRLLKEALYQMIIPQDYDADITIKTFHGWIRSCVLSIENEHSREYVRIEKEFLKNGNAHFFFQEKAPQLMLRLLENTKNSLRYDAILIDEAQDFEQSWFEVIMKTLNPQTNSLLVTCDGIQGIYARKKFHWSSVGISARGRVKRLSKSYRMPQKVGNVAQIILPDSISELLDTQDEFLLTREFGNHQGDVELIVSRDKNEQASKVVERILEFKSPQKILMLFKYNIKKRNYNHPIFFRLKERGIVWSDVDKYTRGTSGLYVGTIHSTKGLECNTIIIPDVNTYQSDTERQLLYVGATRSVQKLILSAYEETALVKKLIRR